MNPWAAHAPLEQHPVEVFGIALPREIFGIEIDRRREQAERPFMARFGDIARIEARGRDVRVTLKSGTVFDLDRFEAGDLDDGVRVWDARRDVVDLDSLQIRVVEFRATAPPGAAPSRLHGTVRARQGDFTGFIQWNRQQALGSDVLDGREISLFGARDNGPGHLGLSVDDPRYGRVLVPGTPSSALTSSRTAAVPRTATFRRGVLSRAASRRARAGGSRGRLVYDVAESETTVTLDAPSHSVDYAIPFDLIATIVPHGRDAGGAELGKLMLHDGESCGSSTAVTSVRGMRGLPVFLAGGHREYLPWSEVEHADLDRPPAMHPAVGGR